MYIVKAMIELTPKSNIDANATHCSYENIYNIIHMLRNLISEYFQIF